LCSFEKQFEIRAFFYYNSEYQPKGFRRVNHAPAAPHSNIAVIEKAEIEFQNGLNVLTGETEPVRASLLMP
jgi:hypothetical protein